MFGVKKFIVCWLLSLSALSGCTTQSVKAWERGDLARPEMAWELDAGLSDYRQHAQTSKEAASGGAGVGGGGCGCN